MNLKIPGLWYYVIICNFIFLQNLISAETNTISVTEIKIGVLAYRGEQQTIDRWQPTINYLNTQFKTFSFRLVTLQLHQVDDVIGNNKLDFIITNTGNYIQLEHKYGISRMATLINKQFNRSTTVFGAVIFTRADRDDINSIDDIKHKSLIAVNEDAFGGFQMAWAEFKKYNLDPFKNLNGLKFTGYPQSQVVQAVLNKEYDVGTFRTDSLEQLANNGDIDLSKIKIINQQQVNNFPFLLSTALYPEWPFSKLNQTSRKLAHRVALALLSIENNSFAANAANSAGWTIPLNYKSVNDLMKDLQIDPYKNQGKVNLSTVFATYWQLITIAGVLFIVILISALFFLSLNKKLSHANVNLENKIIESNQLTLELKHQATHDSLTNVYNRYAFNTFLDKELQRCKRNKTLLAIILIDLDNFKLINDSYGHHVGDDFLKQFCSRIDTELRESDINARLGGDEFAILCLDINDVDDLTLLTKRILKIAEHPYYLTDLDHAITDTSFSLGIAIYPSHGDNAESLLRHADSEMYKMKKSNL